jgi:hypothetical protein
MISARLFGRSEIAACHLYELLATRVAGAATCDNDALPAGVLWIFPRVHRPQDDELQPFADLSRF